MSDLFGKHEDRFSREEVHAIYARFDMKKRGFREVLNRYNTNRSALL